MYTNRIILSFFLLLSRYGYSGEGNTPEKVIISKTEIIENLIRAVEKKDFLCAEYKQFKNDYNRGVFAGLKIDLASTIRSKEIDIRIAQQDIEDLKAKLSKL